MAAHFCLPCHMCSDFMCPPDRPSPIFSTFAVILNGAMVLWHVIGLGAYHEDCASDTTVWTILGIVTAAINILFAFYLYFRFMHKIRSEGGQTSKAAVKILLYDWGVCLYIMFCVWIIVWMVMAGTTAADAASGDDCRTLITGGIIIFIVYFIVGGFMIVLSLLTECCRTPKWRQTTGAHPQVASHVAPGQASYQTDPYQQQHGRSKRSGILGALFGSKGNHAAPAHAPPQQQHQPMYATQQQPQQYQYQAPYQAPYQQPQQQQQQQQQQQAYPSQQQYPQHSAQQPQHAQFYPSHAPPTQNPTYKA